MEKNTTAEPFHQRYLLAPKLLNFFTFLFQYSFYSYRSNFLKKYFNFDFDQIAFAFFFLAIGSFVGISMWANISDRTRRPKTVFLFLILASLVTFFTMYNQTLIESFKSKVYIVTFIVSLFSFFNFGMNPILSSTVLEMLARAGINDKAVYGRQVAFGSLSFVVSNMVLGFFDDIYGTISGFWILLATGLMLVVTVFFFFPNDIDPTASRSNAEKDETPKASPPWYKLLANARFVMFLTVIFLTGCARSFMSVYLTLYYKEVVKFTGSQSSFLLVSGILFEVICFVMSTRVSKIGPYKMLVLAQALMAIRCWAYYLIGGDSKNFYMFLFIELFKGAAFGLTHLAGVKVARESAPEGLEATAQGFYEGCYAQLPSAISVAIGGPAIKAFGFAPIFMCTAIGMTCSFLTVLAVFALSGKLKFSQ